jgi:hypothetical protein
MLYNRCLLIHRWIRKVNVIGFPICPLYPLTGTGLSSVSNNVFKNSDIFFAHLVSRRAKAFALVLAKAVVVTLHLFRDKVQGIVKLFLLINQLKSTLDKSTPFNPKEETSFKVPLFLT